MLRQLPRPPCDRALPRQRPSGDPLCRARRAMELVLRGRADVRPAHAVSPVRPEVTVIGRRTGAVDHRLRDFLTRSAQPFRWLEAGTPEADAALATAGLGAAVELPVLIEQDGTAIAAATVEGVSDAWRQNSAPERSDYDLVIVGAGPAGLAAAVYAASDG